MMEEMVIRINAATGVMSVDEVANGIVSRKNISAETLLKCVRNSLRRNTVSSGLLAKNTISCSIDENGCKHICLWHPEIRADIIYHKTEYKNFPLPRLVFGFSVSAEGRINNCRMGVVKDERLKLQTPMYEYPFSNVSGFHLCTGSNTLPKCTSPHTLASVPCLLLAMPNNDDHYNAGNNKLGLEYRDLLEHLKDKESAYYYTDILITNNKTIQDFIL